MHTGYYTDSILKFRLIFPLNYPDRAPEVHFITDIFHPLISQQDGVFNIASRFRPWRYAISHIVAILAILNMIQAERASRLRRVALAKGRVQEACVGRDQGDRLPEQGSLQVRLCHIRVDHT